MFYSSPRDALQEIAAQELYVSSPLPHAPTADPNVSPVVPTSWNRNWRYHKEMRLWITKETGTPSSQKVPGGEQGTYSYWDPENWEKARKEMTVLYSDLEEKSQPVFAPGATLQISQAAPGVQAQAQLQQQRNAMTAASGPVGVFPGVGVASM